MAKRKAVDAGEDVSQRNDDSLIDYGNTGVLIPDGEYQAVCLGHDTAITFQTPKLYFRFRIVDPGENFGLELFKAYRVKALVGKPGRSGRAKLAAHGDLVAMLYRVLELKRRLDRLPLTMLRNKVFRVQVRTVKTDFKQRPRPGALWYSVVDDILEMTVGTV